jgi:hypothetical protein
LRKRKRTVKGVDAYTFTKKTEKKNKINVVCLPESW